MNILLSIKPSYANNIFAGIKKYEYRKKIPKEKIEKVYVYSSSPIKKIIGFFEVDYIISGGSDEIWEKTYVYSGISLFDYKKYFANSEVAYAIHISKTVLYKEALDPYIIYDKFIPPQSFCYYREIDSL